MWTDVLDLNDFYKSTLGQTTVRLLRARLRGVWPNVRGETVLGLGYATPFLRADVPAVQRAVGMTGGDPVKVFAEVRHCKDVFR